MPQFTTVLLDADGVINNPTLFSLEKDFGISSTKIARFFREAFPDCLIGKADLSTNLLPYLEEWGWRGTVDELLDYWFSQGNSINERVKNIVIKLRENNISVHLATNQERLRVNYMKNVMGYGDLFTDMHPSSDIGYKKPSKEYFASVYKRISEKDKTKILFWDDTKEHVQAARNYGFTSHLFVSDDDFETKMKIYFGL